MRNLELKYGQLGDDRDFVDICENLKDNLIELRKIMNQLLPLKAQYNKMCLPAQIELDLFFAYTLISLQWIHLRIDGIDPTEHPLRDELMKIKAAMMKWQEYKMRDKRPKINVEAAKRFIRSGLYDRYRNGEPPNKKILFSNEE